MRKLLPLLLASATLLTTACASIEPWVKPYEREHLADPIMVELGLVPDMEAYKAQYYKYLMNGLLTQLTRIEPGNLIEQAHMRNRALITRWVLAKGKADNIVELRKRDAKTYVVVNDYEKLRNLFAQLLVEIQRIKSTGDFDAAKKLIESYAIQIDPVLHKEILDRYNALNLAPYKGFVNPVYTPVLDADGNIVDVHIRYDEDYTQQHLRYSRDYSTLPIWN